MIGREEAKLKIFGNHNLLNLQAAYYVCKELGVNEALFTMAIQSFTGAAKRLETLEQNKMYNIYRDFAHAPSKVAASINAVKQQFPERKLVAVLELHTFSSLNEKFMQEYSGTMDKADESIVFYSKHALELKRMPMLAPQSVIEGFKRSDIEVITLKDELAKKLEDIDTNNTNFLFMSSGNYEGLDIMKIITNRQSI
jgi:UDP-N-acetylmuramate: L-alanyl-gamma-D-glutamyl-meso-diaminopimelate ligase